MLDNSTAHKTQKPGNFSGIAHTKGYRRRSNWCEIGYFGDAYRERTGAIFLLAAVEERRKSRKMHIGRPKSDRG